MNRAWMWWQSCVAMKRMCTNCGTEMDRLPLLFVVYACPKCKCQVSTLEVW
jgi:hypothetical protein